MFEQEKPHTKGCILYHFIHVKRAEEVSPGNRALGWPDWWDEGWGVAAYGYRFPFGVMKMYWK
jgi:hypothetical protein